MVQFQILNGICLVSVNLNEYYDITTLNIRSSKTIIIGHLQQVKMAIIKV